MKTTDITDPIFLQAVNALDAGRLDELRTLIAQHPYLLRDKLATPNEEGYFKNPYLVYFVADNPIRNEKLPENIVEVVQLLVDAVKRAAPDTWQQQLTYTLGLVATGRIPRESGKQIAMMDVLIDAGATPGGGMGALAHGNIDAANHLLDRGGKVTLSSAILLNRQADIERLAAGATDGEKLTALTAAAFYGRVELIQYLLDMGAKPNGYPAKDSGFHTHATPLHQAIYSTSLDAVKLLVNAGASLTATDKAYNGTPLGWAMYMQTETDSETDKAAYASIETYLKTLNQ